MLEPDSRTVLLEALRPPHGFVVERAIATTFTLDLTALLTAPLAFSLYDGLLASDRGAGKAGDDPVEALDPYALLKAVRGHAERLTVFCETSRIAAPAKYRRLLPYLEGSVVEVRAAREGGVFHPKLWILRFTRPEDEEVHYRVLCSSRNITFDRSWDTLLVLDGQLTDRVRPFPENKPLGDFVKALPGLSVRGMDAARKEMVNEVAEELRVVRFELPEGVDELRFHPLGIEGYGAWPFEERIGRMLVVSPFVSEGALKRLSKAGREDVLVSRLDQLEAIPAPVLGAFTGLHMLDSAAELEDDGSAGETALATDSVASGLHAKVYVADDGRSAHVWTGSANATTAAFERNVEFLVQMTGKKGAFGVDAVLDGPKGSGGLRALLAMFTPPQAPILPSEAARVLEQRMQTFRSALGQATWVAVIGAEDAERFPLALECRAKGPSLPEGATVNVWPITLPQAHAQRVGASLTGRVADFGMVSFEGLTSFFAFSVLLAEGEETLEQKFVLNVVLEGAPENRAGRLLQSMLDEPGKLLRFLQFLLATDPLDVLAAVEEGDPVEAALSATAAQGESALFESLLHALDREPSRIDAVDQLVRDLSTTEAGLKAFPPRFQEIWEPIRAARATQRARRRA